MKAYFIFLILLFHTSAWSSWAEWTEPLNKYIWHEEDMSSCELTAVPYEAADATAFLENLGDVVRKLEEKPARVNLVYDRHGGKYLGTFYDKNSDLLEPKGYIVPGLVSNNLALSITQSRVSTFTFNDPAKDIKESPPPFIDLHADKRIPALLEMSGVTQEMGPIEKRKFVLAQATGKMDYRRKFEEDEFFLIGRVAYNYADAGNFVWGAGMRQLGFSFAEVKAGSELNGLAFTRSQNGEGNGIILTGDSDKDQAALKKGFYSEHGTMDFKAYYDSLMEAPKIPSNAKALVDVWDLTNGKTPMSGQVLETVLSRTQKPETLGKVIRILRHQDASFEGGGAMLEKVVSAKGADSETLQVAVTAVVNVPFAVDHKALFLKIMEHPEANYSTLGYIESELSYSTVDEIKKKEIMDAVLRKKAEFDQAR